MMDEIDKIFKELGFNKIAKPEDIDPDMICVYSGEPRENVIDYIAFYNDKTVSCFCSKVEYMVTLGKEELNAINRKIKALGW